MILHFKCLFHDCHITKAQNIKRGVSALSQHGQIQQIKDEAQMDVILILGGTVQPQRKDDHLVRQSLAVVHQAIDLTFSYLLFRAYRDSQY